ncbi:COMM domain-containing protein 8 [Copidosoma floridanum]|uniref:COMM domain-containing protein 8 n=1 Tax=Copidosoma floridanum TaxID=29053 RepID=UPI0006C981C2|nr:COMM domain-containing protein 8 [Copidosoma floridanum]
MENNPVVTCNLFNEDKQDELTKFVHLCIDESCTLKGPEFRQFTSVDWTKEQFNTLYRLLLKLFHNPSCLYIEDEKMPPEYTQLPKNVQNVILACLRVRKSQLTDALLNDYLSRQGPTLSDFDWRLKYVMGSSKMASIREPLLQLDLILKDKQKEQVLGLELNLEELDLMIDAIESRVT